MLIYGGYSALLRGAPFHRDARDIDVMCSADEADLLISHLRGCLEWPLSVIPWDKHPERMVLRTPSHMAPSWWRTIEVEVVSDDLWHAAMDLEGNTPAEIGGFLCMKSNIDTDCLIKWAAIEVVPNVNEKHAADIGAVGWTFDASNSRSGAFFRLFKQLLIERYQAM